MLSAFSYCPTRILPNRGIAFIFRMFADYLLSQKVRSQLRGLHGWLWCCAIKSFKVREIQASPDVRIRVTEAVIRVRSRQTANRAVVRIAANVEQPASVRPLLTR